VGEFSHFFYVAFCGEVGVGGGGFHYDQDALLFSLSGGEGGCADRYFDVRTTAYEIDRGKKRLGSGQWAGQQFSATGAKKKKGKAKIAGCKNWSQYPYYVYGRRGGGCSKTRTM